MNGLKIIIRNMELLVIDEVSMLRADLLDMDYMMQTVKKTPFGGVQVLYMVIYCNYVVETRNGVRCAIIIKENFFTRM
jgi:hypothetical protein